MMNLYVTFPVSGVHTWFWLPVVAAFAVSFFTSMAGISGAFLLMPFQMSVLAFGGPAASATNLVFNLFATPGGVWRYAREQRMFWHLAALIILGTLPGIVIGFYLRTHYLPDPARFKLFVGAVMLYLSWRLLGEWLSGRRGERPSRKLEGRRDMADMAVIPMGIGRKQVRFAFQGQEHSFDTSAMLALAFVVGIIGGTYGIGGGAIIAPFCIAVLRLPLHAVAGAALAGTFATSVIGVAVYSLLPLPGGGYATPDWWLGSLFGVGGLAGMYLGAACQRHVPQRVLKGALGLLLAGLGGLYLFG